MMYRSAVVAAGVFAAVTAGPSAARAQRPADSIGLELRQSSTPTLHTLDSLIQRALEVSPRLRADRERIRAASARVGPAGARPDPMLMAGVENLPVTEPGFSDEMTMKMVGITQTIPASGKLAASRRVAEHELAAARAQLAAATVDIRRELKSAYYDIAYLDDALAVIDRSRDVLAALIAATEARYEVGRGAQEDVLRARVDATRLGGEASALQEERRAAIARLNILLDRPVDGAVTVGGIPDAIARAAVDTMVRRITFVSPALGSRAANSPIPSADSLIAIAVRENPILRRTDAMVAAQAARAELARLERKPDIDLSLEYGQRDGHPDMLTATVSLPLRVQRGRVQEPLAAAARAEVAVLEADRHQQRLEVQAEVARLHAQLERARTQLALLVKAILPQSRAALETALASYQAGRAELTTVLEAQATLFNSETAYHQSLAQFARTLAELEQVVGEEILS